MSFLLSNALLYGLLISLVLTVLMGASFLVAPDMWLRSYPPAIKARFGEMTAKAKRLKPIVASSFFGVLLVLAAASLIRLQTHLGDIAGLLDIILSLFITFLVFNLYDLLILDWLLFVRLKLPFFILPGTEGMAAYDDYGFHARAFLRGTLICAAGAGVLGVLVFLLQMLLRLVR